MNELDAVRRLRAHQHSRPQPRTSTLQFHVADSADSLVVAFVRMGGESRPWGVAWGRPGETPSISTTTEPRDRDRAREVITPFAQDLLGHLRTPGWTDELVDGAEDLQPLRQVWLPNGAHLEMLHHLAFAYAFTQVDDPDREMLQMFGRACGWLFRESNRPGQQVVATATSLLRDLWAFPAQDTRQGHLGFLLAWLRSDLSGDERRAAADIAEQRTIGSSLDPQLERDVLAPRLESWRAGGRHDDDDTAAIHATLEEELLHRWGLTAHGRDVIAGCRRTNAAVPKLVGMSASQQWSHLRRELGPNEDGTPPFFISIDTDRLPTAAANGYFTQCSSQEQLEAALVHDDAMALAEVVAAGDAISGRVADVRDEGVGRKRVPVWWVVDEPERPLRLRAGTQVSVVGLPGRVGVIRELTEDEHGRPVLEIEITGLKTRRKDTDGVHGIDPVSHELIGQRIAFVRDAPTQLAMMKARAVWSSDGPGCWLTHGRPGGSTPTSTPADGLAGVPREAVMS